MRGWTPCPKVRCRPSLAKACRSNCKAYMSEYLLVPIHPSIDTLLRNCCNFVLNSMCFSCDRRPASSHRSLGRGARVMQCAVCLNLK